MMATTRGVVCLLATAMLACASAHSQEGVWKNYTSMRSVTALAGKGTTYWAATSGGLFSWNEWTDQYSRYTNAEGLRSSDLTAVALDTSGNVWTGTSGGILQVLPPEGPLRAILDIANTSQTNKKINNLSVYGDTLLVSSDFGLSIFNLKKSEFGDTFIHFGSIPTTTRTPVVSAAIFGGRLWACITDAQVVNEVAWADLSRENILPASAWTLQPVGPASSPRSLAPFNSHLYLATSSGLYVLDGASWSAIPQLIGKSIVSLASSPVALLLCTAANEVFRLDQQGSVVQIGPTLPATATAIASTAAGEARAATDGSGILRLATAGTSWSPHYPNGPYANQFSSVAVDANGSIWCASGPTYGSGVYRFDGSAWQSYTTANSALPVNDMYRVSVACNGNLWASSWGRGSAEFVAPSMALDASHVYGTNVGMVGISNDRAYVVTTNAVCDSRGNTWMSVLGAADRNVLVVRTPGGLWKTFPAILNGSKLTNTTDAYVDRTLAVDAFDNLWCVVRDPSAKGIICLGNRGTIDSTVSIHLRSADGLPSDEVRTLVVDQDNDLWAGTSKGISIIFDTQNPTRDGGMSRYIPLNGSVVNTIAVDPLNQKWVGTTEGAVLLSSDGTQVLASYTVESTDGKLIDNDIKCITVDPQTGTVYFASTSGLASLTTPALAPARSFAGLRVYPNPYLVPNTAPVAVDGLVAGSTLKILSTDGRLIREVQTPGGRIGYWDGKDSEGRDVSSGIYVVVAFSSDGSQLANGKVAVVRR